jgi:plastocyanin
VHNTSEDLSTLVAQGDIGQNALTGESETYQLSEKDLTGISGTAKIEERVNGTTLLTLTLAGTPQDGIHPAHIHENDATTGGGILISLISVDGNTGTSKTQVEQLDDGTAITYDQLVDFNGHINVHLSEAELSTIVAQGNIGSNDDPGTSQDINYDVTNNGATAYIFNGNGMNNMSNPSLTLQRGKTYTFTVNTPGHPFYINSVQGTGTANAYNDGVTNNGASSGTITFTVPSNAPNTLFYNCEFHSSMTGAITITD